MNIFTDITLKKSNHVKHDYTLKSNLRDLFPPF